MSQKNFVKAGRVFSNGRLLVSCLMLVLCCVALAQQGKSGAGEANSTGRYEGTAKNKAEDVITVTLDLTEKDGVLSGEIQSSHGNFTITGGSPKGGAGMADVRRGGAPGAPPPPPPAGKLAGPGGAR